MTADLPHSFETLNARRRRWLGWALLAFFSASLAWAHNPSSSWATLHVQADTMELKLEMASETAWLFLGESPDSAPNIDGSMPRVRAAAAGVYRVSVGDRILTATASSAEQREEDGVIFRLVFARPKGDAPVRFEASYLRRQPAEHRATLTLLDPAENVLRGEILNAGKPAVELVLPAVAPRALSLDDTARRRGLSAEETNLW